MTDLIYDKEAGVLTDRGNFIYTFTGTRFYPVDPRGEEMFIEDIAHSLANSCRFTGHVRKFYSVGEHCIRMAIEGVRRDLTLDRIRQILMHDCSEAWLVDIPRPLKHVPQFGARYRTMEEKLMLEAAAHFGFDWPMFEEVSLLDNVLLNTEQRDLMPAQANAEGPWFPDAGLLDEVIEPWSPEKVEKEFLSWFEDLFL